MGVTTQVGEVIIDPAMVRRPAQRIPQLGGRFVRPIVSLLIIVLAVAAAIIYSGPTFRWFTRSETPTQSSDRASVLRFTYPTETPVDRILLKAGVNITITHLDSAPDSIAIVPPPGDLAGSFTWTVIPHQGSRNVRRLIGEVEWQGRVYKVCEAIDDQEGSAAKYAERYFPLNNGGVRYRTPSRIDHTPFVDFLSMAIADIPIGQQPVGVAPKMRIGAMAERLIPLCLGHKA